MPYRYSDKDRKKKYRLKPVPILTLILIVLIIWFLILFIPRLLNSVGGGGNPASGSGLSSASNVSQPGTDGEASSENQKSGEIELVTDVKIRNSYDDTVAVDTLENDPLWNLILINQSYFLEKEIPMEQVKIDNQLIDKRIEKAYKDMYDAAKKEGITLFLRSGYRTLALQKSYYDANVANYKEQGLSEAEAIAKTRAYYTAPGHSEHHTGLTADITTPEYQRDVGTLDARFAQTEAYKWLVASCADFGFILRYPEDKVDITTISFEPWHYRYVGVSHAKAIMQKGVCLEEYIASLNASFDKSIQGQDLTGEEKSAALLEFSEKFAQKYAE